MRVSYWASNFPALQQHMRVFVFVSDLSGSTLSNLALKFGNMASFV